MSISQLQYESHLTSILSQADAMKQCGPDWIRKARANALRMFLEHGVPSTKSEEWKYTSLRQFAETDWSIAKQAVQDDAGAFDPDSIQIVLVNGRVVGVPSELPEGLEIAGLADAIEDDATLVQSTMGQVGPRTSQTFDRQIEPDIYPFGELNTAIFQDGAVIRVREGSQIERLIEIVHVSLGQLQSPAISAPRLLIVAENGASAKIVENYVTADCNKDAVIAVTEVHVQEGAQLEHVRVQDQCPCSTHIGLWQTRQDKDSTYTAFNVCYGGALSRLDQSIWIGGENCTTRLDGVVCASGEQHIDNHTRLDHAVPHCNSFEIYKQVVDDRATVVFNGKIFVHEDAQKTDAKQTNQALLLSRDATIDSKPQLEIFADDVKCTHGATVGQLEDLPMFYMRSRGVPQDEAQAVLVYAFAAEVLEMISLAPVRTTLERKLYQKLGVDLTS